MSKKTETASFEHNFNELESLVRKLETEALSLEDALSCFENGVRLTRECETVLKEAEQKVKIISQAQMQQSLNVKPDNQ